MEVYRCQRFISLQIVAASRAYRHPLLIFGKLLAISLSKITSERAVLIVIDGAYHMIVSIDSQPRALTTRKVERSGNSANSDNSDSSDNAFETAKVNVKKVTDPQPAVSEELDTVTLSSAAILELERLDAGNDMTPPPSYWDKFYPAREGFSASNLAAAVLDPRAQPYSRKRPFAAVAASARETLDMKYGQMSENGLPYGSHLSGGRNRNAAFGSFDRRALYAIASNEGGYFTSQEQASAKGIMTQQQGNAAGHGSGPLEAALTHASPFGDDKATSFKKMISFMDRVSAEEKTGSFDWLEQRISAQLAYEGFAQAQGGNVEEFTIENALVELLKSVFEEADQRGERIEDVLAEHGEKIEKAIVEAREKYGYSLGHEY